MNFIISHMPLLLQKLAEHIFIAGVSLALAIIIAVPMGIIINRVSSLRRLSLGTANVLQTVPSLALLALLIPLFGIGWKPAIVALTLYALLPILRNTLAGLQSVPAEMIEVADGLGFTALQRLTMVEIPLAMPTILAGIRIAAAMTIGIATIASFIGGGGLGDLITQGLSLNNSQLILLGAIPAAILALLVDFLISRLEKSPKKLTATALFATFGVFLGATGIYLNSDNRHDTIVVAAKNFTEQFILAELIAQAIEQNTDLKVKIQPNLGTTEIIHQAMVNGDIDLYAEYSGTAYLTVLGENKSINHDDLLKHVKTQYADRFGFVWLQNFGFSNSQSLAVRQDFAKRHNLKAISDLLHLNGKLRVTAPPEFIKRADAFQGLVTTYGLEFRQIDQVDPIFMYEAINNSQADIIAAFTTDGRLLQHNLVCLEDDRHFYPSYEAGIVVRGAVINKYPEIANALVSLSIDNLTMQHLNAEVDLNKRSPKEVAKEYLAKFDHRS